MPPVRQLAFDLPARLALGRGDFYVAAPNRLALAQVDTWPDWPGGRLALCGPPGSGKTHLAHVWARRAGARILPARVLAVLDQRDLPDDAALAVEGMDALSDLPTADRAKAEEALFHLSERLASGGGSLLVAGREAPALWALQLADLASRLSSVPVARLGPPDDALLAAVFVKLFSDRQIDVAPDLILYLVGRMERSFEAAHALVMRLDARALAQKRPITTRLAAEVLAETDA